MRIEGLDVLRGLAVTGEGNAARILAACGVTPDRLRDYMGHAAQSEDSGLARLLADPLTRAQGMARTGIVVAVLLCCLGVVDGGAHLPLSTAGFGLIALFRWTALRVRAEDYGRAIVALLAAGATAATIVCVALPSMVGREVAVIGAGRANAVPHDRPLLVLGGYAALGISSLLVVVSGIRAIGALNGGIAPDVER